MRQITATTKTLRLSEDVDFIYERRITPFGNSAKLDAPRKYIGKRAYVLIVKD
jgi:putative transposon-encoded protein